LQQTEIGSTHVAGCVGLITIVILVIWESGVPARWKVIPGALVAVAVGTAVTLAFHLDIKTITLPDNLLSTIRLPTTAVLPRLLDWQILLEAIGIAVVASAETLLSAGAVDRMHQGQRTKYDRELTAQGIGNMICGLLGVLPMTGVIVRSGTNV